MRTVHVELDEAHLAARFERGKAAAGPAVCEQILSDCNQYSVPDDGEHTLKDSGRVEQMGDDFAVTWNTVYAAYQYYGCWPDGSHRITKHTTPGTDILWCEKAKARYGKDWETVARNAFKEGAGG